MISVNFRALFMIAFAFTFTPRHAVAAAVTQSTGTAAAASKHLTVSDVVKMVQAGLSDEVIIARLREEKKPFDLSPDDLIRLKQAKVSDAVLKIMMDPKADLKPGPAPSSQPIVVQSPIIAGLPGSNASGATPGPGTGAVGDQNDPLVPHDSGIYLHTKDRDGKPEMIVLERAAYEGAKSGGMFGTAMTYGIKKTKTRAVIAGPRATLRVSDSSPIFYFYFDDKQAGLGKTHFGVGNLSNPNQFVLLKLEVKKSDRETIIGQYSAFGSSSGSDLKATIPFKTERVRSGLYKVSVDGLKEGEYCFLGSSGMASTGMAAAYGVGVTSGNDIFDFGVDVQ